MERLQPATPPWPRSVRAELEAIDWERHPVVDVVTFAPATSRGLEGDRQRIEVHRTARRRRRRSTRPTSGRSASSD